MNSHHRHKTPESGGVNLGLIITPMLDMSFQILAFFIMTYHPLALEGHLAGSLAAGEVAKGPVAELNDVASGELLDAMTEAPTVIVKTSGAMPGVPGTIAIKDGKADPVPRQVAGEELNWTRARQELERSLKQWIKDGTVDRASIKITADGDLQHRYVLDVYDVCKQAGFGRIHFVPPPNRPR